MSFGQLGKIKLGMAINDLPELNQADTTSSYGIYLDKIYKNRSEKTIYEILPDTLNNKNYIASLSKNVRIFYIGSLKISENFFLEEVTLKFYKDSLYDIKCYGDPKLIEALNIKFGNPKIDITETPKEYINGYGIKTIKIDKEYISTYFSVDNIKLYAYLLKYFSTHTQDYSYLNYVKLYNSKTAEIVIQEEIAKSNLDKRKEEEMKKKLDF
jgi:hypothetical protein